MYKSDSFLDPKQILIGLFFMIVMMLSGVFVLGALTVMLVWLGLIRIWELISPPPYSR